MLTTTEQENIRKNLQLANDLKNKGALDKAI